MSTLQPPDSERLAATTLQPLSRSPTIIKVRLALALSMGLLAGVVFHAFPTPATAQTTDPDLSAPQRTRVVDIRVEGHEQIEAGLILSSLATQVGAPFDAARLTEDIKTIYGFSYFQNVEAYAEEISGGIRIVFVVEEKPRVGYIRVFGNTRLSAEDLEKAISIKVGNVYQPQDVDNARQGLLRAYREEGYFTVRVESQIERINDSQVGLNLLVEETPRVYVTDIQTQGNKVFSELEIRRLMQTSEVDCFDWINDSGLLDEDLINADLQTISSEYLRNGYIRLFIDQPEVTILHNPEFSRVDILLTIMEGGQYFTGELDITGDIVGDKQNLLGALQLETGAIYNPFDQNQDRFILNQIYQDQGYAFVRVIPERKIDDQKRIVDVTYRIIKGEKAYIGRIDIQGNKETRDYVIRREFEVSESELYNGRKLRESQDNIRRLGYFQPGLQLNTEPGDISNVLNVETRVVETQTGTFQAQAGFSEQTKLSLSLSVSKGNLFGRGQTLRLTAATGQQGTRRNFSIDFIEPHLFDTDFSSDSSFSYRDLEDLTEQDRGDFTELRISQGLGIPFFRIFRITFTLEGINRNFARSRIRDDELRLFTTAWSYNTVNHPIFPTDGTEIVLSVTQVGGQILQGSTEYRRYRFRYQRFIGLNDTGTLVLMGRARLGFLQTVGNNEIPSQERFRLGGITTVRGYDFFDIGGPYGRLERDLNEITVPFLDENGDPVLDNNGQPLITSIDKRTPDLTQEQINMLRGGGLFERLFNLELLFPLAGNNVRGVIFYDAGEVNAESDQYRILGEREPVFFDLRQSIGAGIRLISPLGVFRFEYGTKLTRESGEKPDKFDFTISTLF